MTEHTTAPANQAQLVAQRYSAGASAYVRLWSPVIRPMGERLVRELPLADARSVLDIGCGAGALLPAIRGRAPRATIVGVDRAIGMLRVAQGDGEIPLAVMDAQQLAIRSTAVDVAVMAFMLFHLPDPRLGLREAARALRLGGTIGVITWARDPTFPAADVWEEELVAHGAQPEVSPLVDQEDLMDTPDKLSSLLQEAGFSDIRAWTETFEHRWKPEQLIAHRAGHGSHQRRLEALDLAAQSACVARASERVAALPSDAFVYRPELVFAIARR